MHSILDDDKPQIEYLDGHAFPKVSPRRTHALVQKLVIALVDRLAGDRGDVGPEWRFGLGHVDKTRSEFVPDVAFISYERLDTLSDEAAEQPPVAPDLAIEIRSPSHRAGLLARKITKYLATGAVLVLDIDPQRQQIIAHDRNGVRAYTVDQRFEHPALAWLQFDVSEVFPKPRRRDHSS